MRFAIILLALLTVSTPMWRVSAADQRTTKVFLPQAQPVLVWLSAIKTGDQEQLKTAFSESMRRKLEQEGWARVLTIYQDGFKREFGDYTLDDFTFEFTGGEDSGQV